MLSGEPRQYRKQRPFTGKITSKDYLEMTKKPRQTHWNIHFLNVPMDSTHKEHFRNMVGNRMMQ